MPAAHALSISAAVVPENHAKRFRNPHRSRYAPPLQLLVLRGDIPSLSLLSIPTTMIVTESEEKSTTVKSPPLRDEGSSVPDQVRLTLVDLDPIKMTLTPFISIRCAEPSPI